ncbi:MAG: DUF3084 domain-containing protein [Candidatus Cloacimonetes bacterium]|nr:DUF3084 domain-containing protein [Candidatus Cloacimonadota bacterium]
MFRLLALLIVSAWIAFLGDKIGTRIGKKRLSIFGMRPKKTAILMTMFTGMLITITTLLLSSFVDPNIKSALFEDIAQIKSSNEDLRDQYKDLQFVKSTMEKKVKSLVSETDMLSSEKSRLTTLQLATEEQILKLKGERQKLIAEKEQQQKSSKLLQDEIDKKNKEYVGLLSDLRSLETEKDGLNKLKDELQSENKQFQRIMEDLKVEKAKVVTQLNEALSDSNELKKKKELLQKSVNESLQENAKNEKLLASLKKSLLLVTDKKESLQKEFGNQLLDLNMKTKQMKALKDELGKAQKEVDKQNFEIEKVNKSLLHAKQDLNQKQQKLIELADNIHTLKQQSDEAQSIISEMKKESLKANEKIETLQEVLSTQKNKRIVLNSLEPLVNKPLQIERPVLYKAFEGLFLKLMDSIVENMSKKGVRIHQGFLVNSKKESNIRNVFQKALDIWDEIADIEPFNDYPSKGVLIYPVSKNNLVMGQALSEVHFIVRENRLLVLKGKEIARANLDSTLSAESLLAQLFEIDAQMKKQMFKQGILGNAFQPRTPKQIIKFASIVNMIKNDKEKLYLSIVSDDDIYSNGRFAFRYDIKSQGAQIEVEKKPEDKTSNLKRRLEEWRKNRKNLLYNKN